MKKTFTQTIIVFVAVNLITAGFALAQNAPEEKTQEVIEKEVTRRAITGLEGLMMAPLGTPRLSIPGWQHSGSGSVLVIPTAQMKTEDLAAITEDMAVMSRIFDKKLSQARLTTVRSSWSIGEYDSLLFGRSSGAIEAIYLEGYGALFLMKVNVLLSPQPEAPEEKETEEEDTDPLWTQMRQEIYAPEEADRRRRSDDRPEEKYDAEKVAELKETLIKTLKHAANIRTLKPDESVILTVIGKASQSTTDVTRSYSYSSRRRDRSSSMSRSMGRRAPGNETGSFLPTVLTIRAKKLDIDSFAKGQLTFDQFTQKTLLLSYSYLGGNIGGGPSRSSPTDMLLRSLTDGR